MNPTYADVRVIIVALHEQTGQVTVESTSPDGFNGVGLPPLTLEGVELNDHYEQDVIVHNRTTQHQITFRLKNFADSKKLKKGRRKP
jgi:hypothetical protein